MKRFDIHFRACFSLAALLSGLSVYAFAAVKAEHRCAKLENDSCTDTGNGRCGLRLEYEDKCGPTSGADKAECFYCNNKTTKITSKVCLYNPGGNCTTTAATFNCAPDDNAARVGVCQPGANAGECVCDNEIPMTADSRCSQTKTYNGCSG